MTTGSIIVLGIVIAVIAMAIIVTIHDHRSGKCSCGCSECSECCGCCGTVKIEEK